VTRSGRSAVRTLFDALLRLSAIVAFAVACRATPLRAQQPDPLDLKSVPGGSAVLERFIGNVPLASFGSGPIRSYASRDYAADAERAWRAAERALPHIAPELGAAPAKVLPIWILVSPGGAGYEREAPSWSAAIAQPERHLIVISGPALRRTAMNLDETVAHEVVHLVLHTRLGERGWVPQWLDEGLAMRLSGYRRLGDRFVRLGRGGIHLRELSGDFPRNPELARLAYLESEAAVRELLERAPIALLLGRLATGAEFDNAFGATYGESPDAFADRIYAEVGAPWRWIATFGGGATLGLAMAVLAVVGGLRVRRRNRQRLRAWEAVEGGVRLQIEPDAAHATEAPPPAASGSEGSGPRIPGGV
jgi:hypothetical protein